MIDLPIMRNHQSPPPSPPPDSIFTHDALAPAERDIDARQLGSCGPDTDGLAVPAHGDRKVRCKRRAAHARLDLAAAGRAGHAPGGVAGRLGPRTGNRLAVRLDVAREIEVVAVAGAAQVHLKRVAAARVGRPAPDALARPARQRDGAAPRPRPGQAREWPRALRKTGRPPE